MLPRVPFVLTCCVVVGCQLERTQPGLVGMGVSRLTVRNASTLTGLIAEDQTCGFASPQSKASAVVIGQPGSTGSVTWTVENCHILLGALRVVSTDCNGVETLAGGAATVTSTRTVEGYLTGDPNNPVIPERAGATTERHTARLDKFVVRRSNANNGLTIKQGTLAWTARPALAVSASTGLCAVSTYELALDDLSYGEAVVTVDSGDRVFDVEVENSKLQAQLGSLDGRTNFLSGEITVWGGKVAIPIKEDGKGLDPDYDDATFTAAYACKPGLQQPVSRECPTLRQKVVHGSAQLSVAVLGTMGDVVDDDTRCGFHSPAVVNAAVVTGNGTTGEVTYRLTTPCVFEYAAPTVVRTDCHGEETLARGRVAITGVKRVRGLITNDPAQPIIPTTRYAGDLTLEMVFTDFTQTIGDKALAVERGTLSGKIVTQLGMDLSTGVCSIKTPVLTMTDIAWRNGALSVLSGGLSLKLPVDSASLTAQSGTIATRSNYLAGTMTVGGSVVNIPSSGPPELNPAFDQTHFDASYACRPNLRLPASDEECAFKDVLAQSAARLILATAGTVSSMVNNDSRCGFENTRVLTTPDQVVGRPPEMGSMTWSISGCQLGNAQPTLIDLGCTRSRRESSGFATVSAQRVVVGERSTRLVIFPAVIPRARDAATIRLTRATLTDFAAWVIAPGATAPAGKLIFHSGELSAEVRPMLGEMATRPGQFEIPTPVASFTTVRVSNVRASLIAGPKTFALTIPEATLSGMNGSFRGQSNYVTGTVRLHNDIVQVPRIPLDPAFNQAAFDASYVCTENLRGVIPPN